MKTKGQRTGTNCAAVQVKQATERIKAVEAGIQKARTRAELAERRTELAETRTELAEVRAALAQTRAEQAEAALQRLIQTGIDSTARSSNGFASQPRPLDQLTTRQREILQRIAEGMNTKQIADALNLSPKTVEYHRAKLMRVLDVHDIPSLVRLAVRAGLVPVES